MKKFLVVLALTTLALLYSPYAAAEEDAVLEVSVDSAFADAITAAAQGDQVEVAYSEAQDGAYYLVLVMTDESGIPTKSNLVYIDQSVAAGGVVDFTVYPSSIEKGSTYYLYLSANADSGIGSLSKIASFSYASPASGAAGDVTGDGKINALDLLRLKRFLAGEDVVLEGGGDVTGDGKINALDLLRLKRFLAGEDVVLLH